MPGPGERRICLQLHVGTRIGRRCRADGWRVTLRKQRRRRRIVHRRWQEFQSGHGTLRVRHEAALNGEIVACGALRRRKVREPSVRQGWLEEAAATAMLSRPHLGFGTRVGSRIEAADRASVLRVTRPGVPGAGGTLPATARPSPNGIEEASIGCRLLLPQRLSIARGLLAGRRRLPLGRISTTGCSVRRFSCALASIWR